MTHFQIPFRGTAVPDILQNLWMGTKYEIVGVKLQDNTEGKPRPHAELLHVVFPVLQALILPEKAATAKTKRITFHNFLKPYLRTNQAVMMATIAFTKP